MTDPAAWRSRAPRTGEGVETPGRLTTSQNSPLAASEGHPIHCHRSPRWERPSVGLSGNFSIFSIQQIVNSTGL